MKVTLPAQLPWTIDPGKTPPGCRVARFFEEADARRFAESLTTDQLLTVHFHRTKKPRHAVGDVFGTFEVIYYPVPLPKE